MGRKGASLVRAREDWRVAARSKHGEGGDDEADEAKRSRSLKPLLTLKPHLLRYKGMLLLAAIALVASALAMLAVPVAVRGMIDQGFAGSSGAHIDRAFATLIGIGLCLALASSARFFCVNWLGERVVADVRASVFAHLA